MRLADGLAFANGIAGMYVAETRASLPAPVSPCAGCHEQAAALWWEATQAVLDDMLPDRRFTPRAISVDGTSGTLLLCDHRGTPLSQGLMYNDRRATAEAARLASRFAPALTRNADGTQRLFELVGHESLGLTAAMALARHGDAPARLRLAVIASKETDDASRHASIALSAPVPERSLP